MFHLPDIPNVGYATEREKRGSDQIMTFMRDTERDRLLLLTIVIDGREKWRTMAARVFGSACAIDTSALDAIYDYFTLQACRPRTQRLLLAAAQNPAKWRDLVRLVMPHLEREREKLRLMAKWGVQ
jgi:hypothetical protein